MYKLKFIIVFYAIFFSIFTFSNPKLSILIPTLENRKIYFEQLFNKLSKQINDNNLSKSVEIITSCDNGEKTIGHKRNELLQKSKGEYICFVDDDDDVHNEYIKIIFNALNENTDCDCVMLVGIITFDGKHPRKFFHSIKYKIYFEKNNIYYRPPNHLNPIKREIAIKFSFPNISFSEDTDWAMQICKSGLLKKEAFVKQPYYFYLYRTKK